MKKSAVTFLLLSFLAGNTYANNTITFHGKVVDQTCEPVTSNGDLTVNLNEVSTGQLKNVSNATYSGVVTPFNIDFKNCPSSMSKVSVKLTSNDADSTTGNLTDTGNYGSNVQVRVSNPEDGTQLKINDDTSRSRESTITNGAASIPLVAAYYVVDGKSATPGNIVAKATYIVRTN